mgnify:CR=1 FL=1
MAQYIGARIRNLMDKEVRNCLPAECPRLSLDCKVAATPEIHGKMATFVAKFIKDPKKGIDRS